MKWSTQHCAAHRAWEVILVVTGNRNCGYYPVIWYPTCISLSISTEPLVIRVSSGFPSGREGCMT